MTIKCEMPTKISNRKKCRIRHESNLAKLVGSTQDQLPLQIGNR